MKDGGDAAPAPVGWILLALLALYAGIVFYGVGVTAEGIAQHWYEPRGFLLDVPGFAEILGSAQGALAAVGLPAAALAAGVLLTGRSAVAGGLAVSLVLGCLLVTFYAVEARSIWEFFGWRGSLVLWLVALAVGFALTAPWLAASWLRRSWPVRLALYLPAAFAVVAFVRNATGTDPALKYSISPWPAIPVFGFEVGALLVVSWLAGAAVGALALARASAQTGAAADALRLAGVALGLATPVALLLAGSWLGLLPFEVGPWILGLAVAACALGIALAAGVGGRAGRLAERARFLAVGAALVGIPLVAGQALARWDYHVTRERDARAIIDALAAYFEREQSYPDSLQELTQSGDLERVPTPSIGFSFLYDAEFRYQNNGPDFILEFPAPRWVECAYTPPYEEEFEDEEQDVAAGPREVEVLGEAWSCPSQPPRLW